MTANEIRNGFLKFFKERGHTIVPSSPVLPYEDPTLLFTNAGMNQFKDVFLGTGKRHYRRAADSQKCIRVSGKHNDLEEVGRDTYHHTFFEMLGNWSFGDYYKSEAIQWAWELLTGVWGIEKKRLFATVFETDDEAEEYWKKATDIDPSHILRFGKKDNFWEMGETGPCGPCSEIHIDLTPDYSGGTLVNAGDPRVMEIWNLVFIQYDCDAKGTLTPLPAKHVDTGMGFERICAVLQRKQSNYETDVFMPIISRIAEITNKQYGGTVSPESPGQPAKNLRSEIDVAFRVIADHARMLSFSIADGGIPSNEGRGYVMRRILRRAARFGRTLEMREPFIHKVVDAVAKSMGDQYPEIREKQPHIERVIRGEEESFSATLDRGLEIFDSVIERISHSKTFPGEDAFKLYDTYGFPLDLTEMMAKERGLTVETGRFMELMEQQKERARTGRTRDGSDRADELLQFETASEFVGYELLECDTEVLFQQYQESEGGHYYLALRSTPFYTESGGQVGDTGELELRQFGSRFPVSRAFKTKDGAVIHVLPSFDERGVASSVHARIDIPRRHNIERNHTATHLVHEALRRILGTHAHQQGSLVAPDHLRFDFNHFEKITPDQLNAIEEIVNEKVGQSITVVALNDPKEWLTIEEAKRRYPNVKMFFGEKYGERVRIVEIDPAFSVELCGGTHVRNTKEIGLFKIISESSIASGIRRIEAVTGEGLNQYIRRRLEKVGELDHQLERLLREKEELERQLPQHSQVAPSERPSLGTVSLPVGMPPREQLAAIDRVARLREEALEQVSASTHELRKELSKVRVKEASSGFDEMISRGVPVDGFTVVSARIEAGSAEELKSLADTLREKLPSGVGVLGAVIDQKVALVCVVTDDLIRGKKLAAGKIVGELAKRVGGGGGGRPHLATAGGKDISKLDETLDQVAGIIQSMMSG
jgi:alanyl-tRNA synthetase